MDTITIYRKKREKKPNFFGVLVDVGVHIGSQTRGPVQGKRNGQREQMSDTARKEKTTRQKRHGATQETRPMNKRVAST